MMSQTISMMANDAISGSDVSAYNNADFIATRGRDSGLNFNFTGTDTIKGCLSKALSHSSRFRRPLRAMEGPVTYNCSSLIKISFDPLKEEVSRPPLYIDYVRGQRSDGTRYRVIPYGRSTQEDRMAEIDANYRGSTRIAWANSGRFISAYDIESMTYMFEKAGHTLNTTIRGYVPPVSQPSIS